MNLWNHRFSKIATETFEGFLPLPLKRGRIKNILIFIYFLKYESAFKFLISLSLEDRVEILQNFQLYFGLISDFINSFWLNLTFRYLLRGLKMGKKRRTLLMDVPKSKTTRHIVLNYQNCSSTAKNCSNIAKR